MLAVVDALPHCLLQRL
jgi:hypothetical protein